ncbi:hypothetical protein ACS0TY_033080 [Phlomoides rotata]
MADPTDNRNSIRSQIFTATTVFLAAIKEQVDDQQVHGILETSAVDVYADKRALFDSHTGKTLTFAQFKSMVSIVAHGLLQLGIKKNDVVLIFSPNSIEFPICFFGIFAIGAFATTVNHVFTVQEVSK